MLIALLAVLGVDLIVIVGLLAAVMARRRWVSRQSGAFKGAIRVASGDVSGLGAKWRRGYGRWVRDVLVWEKAPFLFRSEFVLVDALAGAEREAARGEVKRVGKNVTIVTMVVEGGGRIDVAAAGNDRERVRGPFDQPSPGDG